MTPRDTIKQRRHERGLSQEQAAELAGITRTTWNSIERGRVGVGHRNANRIAKVLGGDPDEYMTRLSVEKIQLARLDAIEERLARIEQQLGLEPPS